MLNHAEWIVFALILANHAGIPLFAAPALLAFGALVSTGDVNVGIALAGAMAASLSAETGSTNGSAPWPPRWCVVTAGAGR